MKKLALILALVLCLSVLFVSCKKTETETPDGTEENQPDDSKTPDTTTPEAAAEKPEDWVRPYQYDLTPYVTIGEYKKLTGTKTPVDVTEEEIDARIKQELEAKKEAVAIDRPVQLGDNLNIDYTGLMDGTEFENGSATGADLKNLGSANFIPGFQEALVGHNVGEEFTIDVTFPDPYENNPDFAGKAAQFKVKINSATYDVYPELTDELVKEISEGAQTTIADYRKAKKAELEQEEEFASYTDLKNALWEKVYANCTIFKLPEEEVAAKKQSYIDQNTAYAESFGLTLDDLLSYSSMTMEQFEEQAAQYADNLVRQELVFFAMAEIEKVNPTLEEYNDYLEYNAILSGTTAEEFAKQVSVDAVWRSLIWDQVMDKVAGYAVVE